MRRHRYGRSVRRLRGQCGGKHGGNDGMPHRTPGACERWRQRDANAALPARGTCGDRAMRPGQPHGRTRQHPRWYGALPYFSAQATIIHLIAHLAAIQLLFSFHMLLLTSPRSLHVLLLTSYRSLHVLVLQINQRQLRLRRTNQMMLRRTTQMMLRRTNQRMLRLRTN